MTAEADPPLTQIDVLAAEARDPEAFARLFERFAERLHAVIEALMGPKLRQRIGAEDVVQMTFLHAWRDLASFRDGGRGSFFNWLCGIGRHRVGDAVRHNRAAYKDMRREVAGQAARDGDGVDLLLRLSAEVSSPSDRVGRNELKDKMLLAIDSLPARRREILILRELEGRSLQEIADHLNLALSTVHEHLGKALEQLGERLADA